MVGRVAAVRVVAGVEYWHAAGWVHGQADAWRGPLSMDPDRWNGLGQAATFDRLGVLSLAMIEAGFGLTQGGAPYLTVYRVGHLHGWSGAYACRVFLAGLAIDRYTAAALMHQRAKRKPIWRDTFGKHRRMANLCHTARARYAEVMAEADLFRMRAQTLGTCPLPLNLSPLWRYTLDLEMERMA